MKIILGKNSFNKDRFKQLKGTVMGTKIVPTYATLVRGFLEGKMYNRIKDEKDESFAKYTREQWSQNLDDCFIFRESSTANLRYLEHLLNSLHSDIKFKLLKSTNILPFIGIMVIKDKTSIVSDIYFKGTDSKQFLNFKSCHQNQQKQTFPFR